jgi:archaellin
MRKAEMGMGVLIMLIAMIIVSAVTAGVLIGTSGILQQQSLVTGQAARKKITNHMNIDLVRGLSDEERRVKDIFLRVSLTPGSDPASLNLTTVNDMSDEGQGAWTYLQQAECKHDALNGYFNFDSEPIEPRTDPFEFDRSNRFDFGTDETSEFFAGKIAVGIIFVESNGGIQASTEDWDRDRQTQVINSMTEAFNWWREREPRAGAEIAYKIYRNVPTGYEPINNAAGVHSLWLTQVFDFIGAPSGSTVQARGRALANELRDEYKAHWGIVFIVIDSKNDADDSLPGGIESGFAYLNGPYAVVTSETMGSQSNLPGYFAHEIGHLFGAQDQYDASNCNCSDRSGILDVQNFNCDNPSQGECLMNQSSVMRSGMDAIDAYNEGMVDPYARAQMGLIDINGNNVMDPVEIRFLGVDSGIADDRSVDTAASEFQEYTEDGTRKGFFAVERLNLENEQRWDVIEPGESAKICFQPSYPVEAYCNYRITLMPLSGQFTIADIKCPNVLPKSEQVILYEAFK